MVTSINKKIVKKLADYVALNSCASNSSGLYNGKAGMSLALFEAANVLQCEYLEEQAFELLQETLLTRTQDISFENGLSGIGYALAYLINNRLVDADFDELFGEKMDVILDETAIQMERLRNGGNLHSLKQIYFLHYFDSAICTIDKFQTIKGTLFTLYADRLEHQLEEMDDSKSDCCLQKTGIMQYFKEYTEIAAHCIDMPVSIDLLEHFAKQYQQGLWNNDFFIGHSLNRIAERVHHTTLKEIAGECMRISLLNIKPQKMILPELVDFLFRPMKEESYCSRSKQIKQWLFTPNERYLTARLKYSLPALYPKAGYKSGIARLLLLMVNELTKGIHSERLYPL
nr:hypothetical protein [uncultured Bacteroides sp.]